MSIEKHTSRQAELTRKQKITKRFVPVALVASGVAAYGISNAGSGEHEPHQEARASALVGVRTSVEIGGAESNWGHGAAEKAIHHALVEGLSKVYVPDSTTGKNVVTDADSLIEKLPVYDEAEKALEFAHYDKVMPDVGDVLTIDVDVSVDSEDGVTYEVTGAEIQDTVNNSH